MCIGTVNAACIGRTCLLVTRSARSRGPIGNGVVVMVIWRHRAAGATAGLAMPALPLLGARYYQEIAPGVALDRAEVMSLDGTLRTPHGMVERVLVTKESSPLEPGVEELKSYGAGIGLVRDDDMLLMSVTPGAPRR